jgi:hypothetical protein
VGHDGIPQLKWRKAGFEILGISVGNSERARSRSSIKIDRRTSIILNVATMGYECNLVWTRLALLEATSSFYVVLILQTNRLQNISNERGVKVRGFRRCLLHPIGHNFGGTNINYYIQIVL